MKKHLFSVACAVAAALCAADDPQITVRSFSQNASRVVTIEYELSADAIVTLDMMTNGVSIGADNYRTLRDPADATGSYPVSKHVKKGVHRLLWYPSREWPGYVFTNGEFSVSMKAWTRFAPPDYMVVDLLAPSNRWFYASPSEMPDGGLKTADPDDAEAVAALSNDVYRTSRLVMRRIPAAANQWRMGSPETEFPSWRGASEVAHYVTLSEDYYIAIYETTVTQMGLILKTSGRSPAPFYHETYAWWRGDPTTESTGCNWPVHGHAVAADSTLRKWRDFTGLELDLPTEAQWEYACRAGTESAFADGNANSGVMTWDANNVSKDFSRMVVGIKKPNGWGIYDMHGNVREWTLDQYQVHPSEPCLDPKGAENNPGYRVLKGCGCRSDATVSGRSAARGNATVDTKADGSGNYFGARLCCPVTIPSETL